MEKGGKTSQSEPSRTDSASSVSWEASEYIHHQKTAGWFMILGLGTAVLGMILYLVLKDIFSVIVLVLMAVTIGIFAARPPRTLGYKLSRHSLTIGPKEYPLDDFRSFSLAQEGAILSITFLPTKRFMVPVTVYFSPEDEAKILTVLDASLPHEERSPDIIDRWTSRLRF